ncbi:MULTISPECIES: alpha-2-macroglobulin [unclassified Xanthobacter]|uniref:alpha-2-macroglobulin n=1 Tax=unclassified Xanthobacter TaxID=2623496 RepID=UPI001F35164A|nr:MULTISPECIES: alpha-2-macroglobulin [unclassified Xanthobacter]
MKFAFGPCAATKLARHLLARGTSGALRVLGASALALAVASGPALAQPRPPAPIPAPAPATTPPATAPAPARPAALKSFQRADLVTSAKRYERYLRREVFAPTIPLDRARRDADQAFQRNDARSAAALYGSLALAVPQDAGVWLRLARSLAAIKPTEDENASALTDNALAAAYISYRRAGTRAQEADALGLIGRLYASRGLWNAALETMKASLELRDAPAERAFYEKLREEHGFRLVDYSVEADSANPRACVQFSDDLATGADFAPFVQVAELTKPAVTAEARQICVEGLKHGERYTLRVRPGVPAANGESLRKPVELSFYVRDRAPSVHFTGRNYVLPRTGQKGVPLVSVNTRAVKVNILRIGDRALVPTAIQGEFRQNIDSYVREQMAAGTAISVYSGILETESPLNGDVTTAVPITDAIGKLEPGVYVMTAKPDQVLGDDEYGSEATQWFIVSDLGLTALSGLDGVHVMVRALGTAQPVADATVQLVAKSNEVLGEARSDADGIVRFDPGLSRGPAGLEPEVVIARTKAGDYAFLSLKEMAFDLTDRGVAGREAPGALDAFVTPERGVYRSGETVHLTVLLRDAQGRAATGVPLTVVLQRPDGVEDRRLVVADQSAGGRTVDLTLLKGAMTGTWRARAFTDPKLPAIGEASFLVEDYVPDRVEFTLSARDEKVSRTRPAEILLEGRFLFGAPAAGLDVEAETEVRIAESRKGFEGYRFGNSEDNVFPERQPVADAPRTDAGGKASLKISAANLPRTDRPLEMETLVRLVEAGGRAVQRTIVLPVAPAGSVIGVKPLFSDRVREGESANFDVAVVGVDDKPLAAPSLTWRLSKIETRYQWYKVGSSWDFEPVKVVTRVGEGRLATPADGPARLAVPTEYGRYRLDVTGDGLPLTSLAFESGFGGDGTADTPDKLELTLDRPAFSTGDNLEATITARTAGTATVMVVNEGLLAQKVVPVSPGANKVSFKVAENWGPGAYLVAFLHRPLDVAAGRMPGRAIGLAWFSVNRDARTLKVELSPPGEMRPDQTLAVPVRISGIEPGAKAFVTVAAVDVGILNLTGFKPPAPDAVIFGQRRLSPEIRDLYGMLIDGMQGNAGRLRSGGDGGEAALQASPPTQAPLALFSGIVPVATDGTALVSFPIPAFDGTVRLMAMAWSADKLGHGSTDVVVRDKVVVLATLPRFLASGDRSTLTVDLANVEAPAGTYRLDVTATGAAAIPQPAGEVTLAEKQRTALRLAVDGKSVGPATIDVKLTGQGVEILRSFALNVRPAYPQIERRTVRTLAPGESLTLSKALLGDVLPGTGSVAVSVTPNSTIDVPALLAALDRYPYGCAEQITSRALPLLSYNDLSALVGRVPDPGADGRIRDSVTRLMARQGSDGSFGLWSAGGEDTWLDAYVADFLTRAKEKGFAVPEQAFNLALDRLRNTVNLAGAEMQSGSEGLAYALYVLARNGRAPLGDLRYIADTRLKNLTGPLAQGQVAAALALLGDRTRAERVFNVALEGLPATPADPQAGRADFGSVLRDAAALTVLAREAGMEKYADIALARVDAARTRTERTSTQENAWLILAATSLVNSAKAMALDVDGAAQSGVFGRTLSRADLERAPLTVRNSGPEPVKVVVSINGAPVAPEPAIARGFELERRYYTLDGKPADPSKATQNQRFAVVLKVNETESALADILLVDYLPAGFEIENPNLVQGGEDGAFAWLDETSETSHVEFRDDRFVAAVTRQEGDDPFVVAYVVRAVSPGRYAHPPAVVEDMYRPDRFARTGSGTVEVAPAK